MYVDESKRFGRSLGALLLSRAGAAAACGGAAAAAACGGAAAAAADTLDDAILMCWKTLVRRIVQEVRLV